MCCFCLHFSDFNVLFFQKKNVAGYFEKTNMLCKNRANITCREEKYQLPPPRILNGPSLNTS